MKHSFGLNTIVQGMRFRYLINKGTLTLFSDETPIDGFVDIGDGVYKKDVPLSELKNSFQYITKCSKGQLVFLVRAFLDKDRLDASTENPSTAKELNIPAYDRNEYIKTFMFSELDAIWEERSEGYDGLPYPEDLPRIAYIKGGPEV